MADLAPPDDLVALKAAWYDANARAEHLAAAEPEGDRTIARIPIPGRPDTPIRLFSDEQNAALDAVRAERLELTMWLARHPWKAEQSDVHEAEKALNEAAFGLWQRTSHGDAHDVG